MKEVKFIELVLENCEVIRIERKHIGSFFVSNITRSISRIATNSISDSLTAEDICIQVSPKANTPSSFRTGWSDDKATPFERIIMYDDIAAINIVYQDESEEYIFVNWGGDSKRNNIYQTSMIAERIGNLYIVISEKKKVETYFVDFLEEDPFYWDLYSEDK